MKNWVSAVVASRAWFLTGLFSVSALIVLSLPAHAALWKLVDAEPLATDSAVHIDTASTDPSVAPLPAQEPTNVPAQSVALDGQMWFERMQHALQNHNFSASLVHVQGQRVELFRWLHGQSDDGQNLEVLYSLNGPEIHIVRRAQRVSYFHPMISPYSVRARSLFGPIPLGFYNDYAELAESYNAVAMGGARVIDRPAVHVRLVPRDQERFGYSIWLDRETGMLLRVATVSPSGDILEQIQITSMELSEEINPDLLQVKAMGLPPLARDEVNQTPVRHAWQKNWMPVGFKQIRANHHQLPMTGIAADYFLYSDGMTRISIYISEDPKAASSLSYEGLDSLYSHQHQNYTVTAVGRVPMATLQRIALSVRR